MNPWGYQTPVDYLNAARTTGSSNELEFLAASQYDFVRLAVAENSSVTPPILLELVPENFATWNEQELAGAIAANTKVPIEALKKIAIGLRPYLNRARGNDMAGEAILRLCDNPAVPLEIVKVAIDPRETSPRIRKKIANNCSRKDVLELLSTDPSTVVQSRAAQALSQL